MRHYLSIIAACVTAGCFSLSALAAEFPQPHLHLSFDQEFRMEGIGVQTLKTSPDSPFPGLAKVPAGEFVAGISGKGFIPRENVTLQGENVFPAPEGTLSLWIKPVNYEADWIGGPALSTGRIGAFLSLPPWSFKTDDGVMGWAYMPVRLNRHDCCSGLAWVENWNVEPTQLNTSYSGPIPPFAIWQKDKWRMLTVVWFKGERRVYFNGVRIQHCINVKHNPIQPGQILEIPAGSKVVDDLLIWDKPLSDGQVAALFYAQMAPSGLLGAIQDVPRLPDSFALGSADWNVAACTSTWVDVYSGMAVAGKPYTAQMDTLEIGHRDGSLYVRYREPMPENYLAVKTLLGGHVLKRIATGRDSDIRQDDCLEIHLTGDSGKTRYVLGVSASGTLFDSRNGDRGFNLADSDWTVSQSENEKFWTVEMKINLKTLNGGAPATEWGFNCLRTVRQQGHAQYQWSFAPGEKPGFGIIRLVSIPAAVPAMTWSPLTGRLGVAVTGGTDAALNVTYRIKPLNFLELFPEEAIDKTSHQLDLRGMVIATGRLDNMPPPVEKTAALPAGAVAWEGKLDYAGEWAALAEVKLADGAGRIAGRRTALVSGNQAVSLRLHDLPSRKELVVQIFLASETLAGTDVGGEITLKPDGAKEPVLRQTVAGFAGIMEEKTLGVAGLAVGKYQVEVTLRKQDAPLGKAVRKWFKSGAPEWLGNDIGIVKTVPAPWTPVTVQGERVGVWGRDHGFSRSLLPATLRVLDEEILAGPMRLLITTDAGTLDTAVTETPVMKADTAGIRATITGQAIGQDLKVEMAGVIEFDGFADLKFTLSPLEGKGPVTVKSIVFEAPFRKQYAVLYDDSSYNMFATGSGTIPAEGMAVAGTGTVRVGDTRRGVQFYPLFTTVGRRSTATPLSFTPEPDAMRLRYVISEGVSLDKPATTTLGFIGTPVKPFDAKRFRLSSIGPGDNPALREKGFCGVTYWFSTWTNFNGGSGDESGYFNYTPEWCKGLAASLKNDWETKRNYSLLKIQPGLITARSPEYALFWKEWGGQYIEGVEDHVRDLATYRGADVRPPGVWTGVDWTRRSWQDFFFYGLDKVLAVFAAEGVRVGIYVDCTDHHGDPAPYRPWMQRLYQVTRKHSPDGIIMVHMSGDRRMAVWGLADRLAEGEQYSANWGAYIADKPELTLNDCHPTVLPLNRMRATYAGTLWGPQPVFLSQFWTDPRQQEDVKRKETGDPGPTYYRRMRYSTGLMMAHDAQFWGEFYACCAKEEPGLKRALWGFDETVEFIPYWDERKLIEVEGAARDTAVVSAWLRPEGNLMAIVLNTANAAATVPVKVNADKFPVKLLPFSKAVDITSPVPALEPEATQPAAYPYRDGVLEVDMRPRDFRLLVFE